MLRLYSACPVFMGGSRLISEFDPGLILAEFSSLCLCPKEDPFKIILV